MKKSFLDNAAMLPINIDIADESTLYENTGVDYDKVRNKVCESLHMNKTKKNKLTLKKLFIVAAAAVLIVSVFSLPVIAESVYMVYCYVVSYYTSAGGFYDLISSNRLYITRSVSVFEENNE